MVSIFIEGHEENFLKTLLKSIGKESELESIEFIDTGGYTNLEHNDNKLRENNDTGKKNIVLFDADYESNGGGFNARLNELKSTLETLDVEAEFFLFPNNKDNGDFELLLENCINNQHSGLLKCFNGYLDCISKFNTSEKITYESPDRKAKIYSYISAFPRSRKQKERFKNKQDWSFSNSDYWNLDSDYLTPLADFLKEKI